MAVDRWDKDRDVLGAQRRVLAKFQSYVFLARRSLRETIDR